MNNCEPPSFVRDTIVAAIVLLLFLFWVCTGCKAAQEESLDLARVLVAEAGRERTPDHVAILYVFEHRRMLARAMPRPSIRAMALRYSVAFNGRSRNPERAARMRALAEMEIPPHIRSLVAAWERGERPADPCRGRAMHFADPALRTPLHRVDCGETVNAFYEGPRSGR